MLRRNLRLVIVLAALVASSLGGACINIHEAEDCTVTLTCPPPDAGDGGDGAASDSGDH